MAAGDDMVPRFADRKWFLSKGGPVQTYRTTESKTRGGPSSLLFHSDGTFEVTGPGKADQPSSLTGRWRSDPGDPTQVTVEIGGQSIEYRIVEVREDELRLEKLAGSSRSSSPQ